MTKARARIIGVLLFDDVVLADVAGPSELFRRARRADGSQPYEVRLYSATPLVHTDLCAVRVPGRLAALREADTILVPGMAEISNTSARVVLDALRTAAKRGVRIASICTGAFVLAAAGLLHGKRATTHWAASSEFARRFPDVELDPNVLFVDASPILTSAGATAGLDMCLHIIRTDCGASVAARTARMAVIALERSGGQAQFVEHNRPRADYGSMQPLLRWIDANLNAALDAAQLAERAAVSVRTLHRRFLEQTGATPSAWIQHARVRKAQTLLETTQAGIDAVAEAAGFASPVTLRDAFRRVLGITPTAYRRAFGHGAR